MTRVLRLAAAVLVLLVIALAVFAGTTRTNENKTANVSVTVPAPGVDAFGTPVCMAHFVGVNATAYTVTAMTVAHDWPTYNLLTANGYVPAPYDVCGMDVPGWREPLN